MRLFDKVRFQATGLLLRAALRRGYARFLNQLNHPLAAQDAALSAILCGLARTQYGRSHEIEASDGYAEFKRKLPVVGYEDLARWMERQVGEENSSLAPEQVLFYERTSGSSGPSKLIPYTKSFRRSINSMFQLWLYDLLASGPRFQSGKTFLSISPLPAGESTSRGVRIGAADDRQFLEDRLSRVLAPFFIPPPEASRLQRPENFIHVVALSLLNEAELEIVSIWNPSFLTVILDYIENHRNTLVDELRAGSVVREGITFSFNSCSSSRIGLLSRSGPIYWNSIWPRLKLISCWGDGNARPAAERLREKFPGVLLQPKGLLATEAPVTFPMIDSGGFVPLLHEVFFEFEEAGGEVRRLHELRQNQEYSVIITQKGGLARYRLGDRVRVSHFFKSTPCLEFTGRAGSVCDMVGEKLNEEFAGRVIGELPLEGGGFHFLLPINRADKPYYALVVDREPRSPDVVLRTLDEQLQSSCRYKEARLLGQLAKPELVVLPGAEEKYLKLYAARGSNWGTVKHRSVISDLKDAGRLLELINSPEAAAV